MNGDRSGWRDPKCPPLPYICSPPLQDQRPPATRLDLVMGHEARRWPQAWRLQAFRLRAASLRAQFRVEVRNSGLVEQENTRVRAPMARPWRRVGR